MNTAKILGTVRTVLALVAGALVAFGIFDESVASAGQEVIISAIGGVLGLITWISSIMAPEKQVDVGEYTKAAYKAAYKKQ